jgi:hypothetical protein
LFTFANKSQVLLSLDTRPQSVLVAQVAGRHVVFFRKRKRISAFEFCQQVFSLFFGCFHIFKKIRRLPFGVAVFPPSLRTPDVRLDVAKLLF